MNSISATFLKKFLYTTCFVQWFSSANPHTKILPGNTQHPHSYYFSNNGNDTNTGSKIKPWKTIDKLNHARLLPGDICYFEGGQTFTGSILLSAEDAGTVDKPIVITSCGNGKAMIDGGNASAITIYQTSFVQVKQLALKGAGRKTGNTTDGLIINLCTNITADSISISGFQKSGLLVNSSNNISIKRIYAAGNGFAGINAVGQWNKKDCSNIHISYCKAENNPGDPTNFTNHSGNGILVGYCRNVIIEYCSATNNGWDMPRKGNGPVGIWCFEADSVMIQHCISYKNKTAAGAADGGGFDLDGGVTNSIIQYCLSYENDGSGYGLFQYAGAATWNNNTIRYCISENDGSVSAAHAGVFIWNSSGDSSQLSNCFFYNNTVYNTKGAAISYEALSANSGFRFYNNIFVAKDSLIIGKETNSVYLGNNWFSLKGGFIAGGATNFSNWANTNNKEQFNNKLVGFNIDPLFLNPGRTNITDPALLNTFNNYRLAASSLLRNNGLDLKTLFGIDNGGAGKNQVGAPK